MSTNNTIRSCFLSWLVKIWLNLKLSYVFRSSAHLMFFHFSQNKAECSPLLIFGKNGQIIIHSLIFTKLLLTSIIKVIVLSELTKINMHYLIFVQKNILRVIEVMNFLLKRISWSFVFYLNNICKIMVISAFECYENIVSSWDVSFL